MNLILFILAIHILATSVSVASVQGAKGKLIAKQVIYYLIIMCCGAISVNYFLSFVSCLDYDSIYLCWVLEMYFV